MEIIRNDKHTSTHTHTHNGRAIIIIIMNLKKNKNYNYFKERNSLTKYSSMFIYLCMYICMYVNAHKKYICIYTKRLHFFITSILLLYLFLHIFFLSLSLTLNKPILLNSKIDFFCVCMCYFEIKFFFSISLFNN